MKGCLSNSNGNPIKLKSIYLTVNLFCMSVQMFTCIEPQIQIISWENAIRKTLGKIRKPLFLNTYADVLREKKEESEVLSHVWLFETPLTVDFQARILEWVAICFSLTQESNLGLVHCRQTLLSELPEKPQMHWHIDIYTKSSWCKLFFFLKYDILMGVYLMSLHYQLAQQAPTFKGSLHCCNFEDSFI